MADSDQPQSPSPSPPTPSAPVNRDPAPGPAPPSENPLLVTPTDGDLGKLARPPALERGVIKLVIPED